MKKMDLRVIKTLKRIDESIVELLREKSFEDITVKDICEHAMINRGTFYSHYKDKYDLIDSYQKELIIGVEDVLYRSKEVTQKEEEMKEILEGLFVYIEDHKDKIFATAIAVGRLQFIEEFSKYTYKFYEAKQKEYGITIAEDNFRNYLITYMSNAHIGIIHRWLEGGCKGSPKEMANIVETITVNGIFKSLLVNEEVVI
ncbi:TetR/AcrR family transcriptional regulator [Nosocomiicoccus massiliensis]|uniref:TetR/AcrR family transcriptional regulator n=1 Tax=Nosocomiicoccus massiliensis TaxID=1232430 RepID=UPI0003FF75CC|nr:TetR/AcrR family transcriptional regulator C-terminal domain-containing protein [Nosocomiicoccus massiliensis]